MITAKEPYYKSNNEWFYFDPRGFWGYRLTDKATQKAIDSCVQERAVSTAHTMGYTKEKYIECVKETMMEIQNEIEDYKRNKHRYEFQINEFGTQELVKIDGKEID